MATVCSIKSVFDDYSKGQVNLFADHLHLNFFTTKTDRRRLAEFFEPNIHSQTETTYSTAFACRRLPDNLTTN